PARKRLRVQRGNGGTWTVIPCALNPVGLPVIHSTSLKAAKTLPTTERPLTCRRSPELSQPMISPVECAKPAFKAAYRPLLGWLNQHARCASYLRIISTVLSVEPSSTMMYSRFGYSCDTME